jgi:FAD/FMN-containing dehydrogenase
MSTIPVDVGGAQQIINDVTGLNPVPVWAIVVPTTSEEIRVAISRTTGPLCIGGGRFSMGGQTASPGALHIDMRRMNAVLEFSPLNRTIRVQAGIRWCDQDHAELR